MAIEWTSEVRLAGGETGHYLGRCQLIGKHRVATYRHPITRQPLVSIKDLQSNEYSSTVWLLDDNGKCRGDLAPCEQDYAGPA